MKINTHTIAALLAVLGIAVVGAGDATAQPFPPNLPEPRGEHTATLLQSGKLLIAGGNNENGRVAITLLFDPATNSWTTSGSLATPRFLHTATLLPSGKVLVAGGMSSGCIASAEVFNALINTWAATESMAIARCGHTATLLPNGKVLVVGGNTASGPTGTAELYDPATDNWTTVSAAVTARYNHTATLLTSGRVLVAGGQDAAGALDSIELYDASTNTWAPGPSLAGVRTEHSAALLPSGKVLVAGGAGNTNFLDTAELYDPVANGWTAGGTLSKGRKRAALAVLASGNVVVAGGYLASMAQDQVDQYDVASNSWTPMGRLVTPRWDYTVTALASGKLLAVGGYLQTSFVARNNGYLASVELFDTSTGTWIAPGALIVARTGHTATSLPNGKVLIVGGDDVDATIVSNATTRSVEIYDPVTSFSTFAASLTVARSGHTATLLPNGKVLVLGPDRSGELYDPQGDNWTPVANSAELLSGPATLLPNGKVLAFGRLFGTMQLYDAVANTWTTGPAWGAYASATVVLPSRKVLVIGGFVPPSAIMDPIGASAAVALYDPATGTLLPVASLPEGRGGSSAILMPNGKVLVVGGGHYEPGRFIQEVRAGALAYDPSSDAWTTSEGGDNATAGEPIRFPVEILAALASGNVFWLSGDSAYIYEPLTDRWARATRPATPRMNYSATPMLDGKVLLAGGNGGFYGVRSVDLYDPMVDPNAPPLTIPFGLSAVKVVEYYNASLDHYFVSSLAPDINALDMGVFTGWARTGRTFGAYPSADARAFPVCRFYIPPEIGDSHFYSASPQECAEVQAKFPMFTLESASVMYVGVPDTATGSCANGWTPVYRVWDGRIDSNHRYTTERQTRDQMVAKGWIAEGYGADQVVMCAPL